MHKELTQKKKRALTLARQARGTLDKVIDMIENDAYCPEIMQQSDSIIGLLKTVKKELLCGHLNTCAVHQLKKNKEKAIQELLKIYNLSN